MKPRRFPCPRRDADSDRIGIVPCLTVPKGTEVAGYSNPPEQRKRPPARLTQSSSLREDAAASARGDHLDGPLDVLTNLIGLLDEPDPTFAMVTPDHYRQGKCYLSEGRAPWTDPP